MRVRCFMRLLRGETSTAEVAEITGVARPTISRLENGVMLPYDRDIPKLETFYGPITDWYPAPVLLALEFDDTTEEELRKRLWSRLAETMPSDVSS